MEAQGGAVAPRSARVGRRHELRHRAACAAYRGAAARGSPGGRRPHRTADVEPARSSHPAVGVLVHRRHRRPQGRAVHEVPPLHDGRRVGRQPGRHALGPRAQPTGSRGAGGTAGYVRRLGAVGHGAAGPGPAAHHGHDPANHSVRVPDGAARDHHGAARAVAFRPRRVGRRAGARAERRHRPPPQGLLCLRVARRCPPAPQGARRQGERHRARVVCRITAPLSAGPRPAAVVATGGQRSRCRRRSATRSTAATRSRR